MPELPDVEVYKRHIDSTALNKRVTSTDVPDPRVLENCSPDDLANALTDKTLRHTRRWGKYLFAEFGEDQWLALHFRMTSYPRYFETESGNQEREARYDAVRLHLDDGHTLAFNSRRKLGRISLLHPLDPDGFADEHKLGPDALSVDEAQFNDLLGPRGGSLKSQLMNQKLISGLGNVYSDEILFQARMHPDTPVDALDDAERSGLFQTMRAVVERAIRADADPARMPDDYLTAHRREGAACPRCQSAVQKIRSAGRSAFVCPSCQPAP